MVMFAEELRMRWHQERWIGGGGIRDGGIGVEAKREVVLAEVA